MKIIDTRSGKRIRVGETIHHADHEWTTLLAFKASQSKYHAGQGRMLVRTQFEGVTREQWIDCPIRTDHPAFPDERVAFLPS